MNLADYLMVHKDYYHDLKKYEGWWKDACAVVERVQKERDSLLKALQTPKTLCMCSGGRMINGVCENCGGGFAYEMKRAAYVDQSVAARVVPSER